MIRPHGLSDAECQTNDKRKSDDASSRESESVPAGQLAEPIPRRGGTCLDRLLRQEPADIGREAAGRLITPPAILLKRLHDDPIQLLEG